MGEQAVRVTARRPRRRFARSMARIAHPTDALTHTTTHERGQR